ncbi:MAG TPA: histidine kinase [Cellvibrio sp.]|nr:histidine kinase [Cellvibrio sp.]
MTAKIKTSHGDFLPNLCHPQAILLLVLATELIAILLSINVSALPQLNWQGLGLYSFQIQWISMISALAICRLRPQLNRWPATRSGLVAYGTVLAITLVFSLLGQVVMQLLIEPSIATRFTLDIWQLIGNLITAAILAGIFLRYLYLQQQLRNQQQAELQSRIQALQSRIRPHFLFNSMNSIASLIGSDPERAERVVEDLAELFRASLAEPALIPIANEINLCRRYLEIEQLRLGDRLAVEWQIGELGEKVKIPSLILQPLVENAIFHGIEPLPKGGKVSIKIARVKQQLAITIANPYLLGKKSQAEHAREPDNRHNSMALDNIRRRLRVHYGAAARLSASEEHGLFTTYIFCPLPQ